MPSSTAPTVELAGRTYVMVPHETNQLVQSGNTVVISRREVESVVAKLERYEATNNPVAQSEDNKARLAAYRQLLDAASDAPAQKKKS